MTVNGLVLFEWVLDWNDRRGRPTEAPTDAFEPEPEAAEPVDD
jgi:hypothetical protein